MIDTVAYGRYHVNNIYTICVLLTHETTYVSKSHMGRKKKFGARITLPLSEDMLARMDETLKENEPRVDMIRDAIEREIEFRHINDKYQSSEHQKDALDSCSKSAQSIRSELSHEIAELRSRVSDLEHELSRVSEIVGISSGGTGKGS